MRPQKLEKRLKRSVRCLTRIPYRGAKPGPNGIFLVGSPGVSSGDQIPHILLGRGDGDSSSYTMPFRVVAGNIRTTKLTFSYNNRSFWLLTITFRGPELSIATDNSQDTNSGCSCSPLLTNFDNTPLRVGGDGKMNQDDW